MLTTFALTALLALGALPQRTPALPSLLERAASVASAIFSEGEGSRVYLKVGGITRGAGFSLGPAVRLRNLAGGPLDAHGRVSVSYRRYFLAEGSLVVPDLGRPGLQAGVFGRRRYFPQEDFFGMGRSSSRDDRVSYTYDENAGGAFVAFKPRLPGGERGPLTLDARIEYRVPDIGRGHDGGHPSIEQLFDPAQVPGLAAQPAFLIGSLAADFNRTKPDGRPVSGGRYTASLSRFAARGQTNASFDLLQTELRQYVPLSSDRHLVALRAAGVFTSTSGANEVPFYYMPNLGGKSGLRGYHDFRFHERQMVLLQAEYRLLLWRFVEAAAFYDAGAIGPRVADLSLGSFLTDYGIGLRGGTANRVFVRADVAFGGREGTRAFVAFGEVF